MTYIVIGAIGDSITQGYFDEEGLGWFGRLSQKIAKTFPLKYGFNNMSESGDRICDAYYRLTSELTKDCNILIFAIGVNDIVRRGNADTQEDLSPLLRSKYWDKCFTLAKKTEAKILVLDILPIIEIADGVMYDEEDPALYYFNKDIVEYNKLLKTKCLENDAIFVERYKNWEDRNLSELYLDTVHPNAKGHQLIADEVYDALVRLKLIG